MTCTNITCNYVMTRKKWSICSVTIFLCGACFPIDFGECDTYDEKLAKVSMMP